MNDSSDRVTRRLASIAAILFLLGAGAPARADAATATQPVSGTAASVLAVNSTAPGALTGVSPGATASGSGQLTVQSTLGSWTLSVNDTATSNAGHLQAATTGCTGSEAFLLNPLAVSVSAVTGSGTTGTLTPASAVSISATNQTVATGSGTDQVATNYTNAIGSAEALRTGCVYSLTATYTVQ